MQHAGIFGTKFDVGFRFWFRLTNLELEVTHHASAEWASRETLPHLPALAEFPWCIDEITTVLRVVTQPQQPATSARPSLFDFVHRHRTPPRLAVITTRSP